MKESSPICVRPAGDGDGSPFRIAENSHHTQPDTEFPEDDQKQHDAEQRKIVDDYGGNDEGAERDEKHGNERVAKREKRGVSFVQILLRR